MSKRFSEGLQEDAKALVLKARGKLALRLFPVEEALGLDDLRIAIHTVGIGGSDIQYDTHGATGPFVVRAPMILGHEAPGTVVEIGRNVTGFSLGDRVCMEPGSTDLASRAAWRGLCNLDPAVRFWATPPVHGVLRRTVVHPARLTFPIPDGVSFGEAAMVEPLAVGIHAANKARARAGHVAVVIGAGPIGLVTALAVLAAGAGEVIVSDIDDSKPELAASLGPIVPVNVRREDLAARVAERTGGRGADAVHECSGNAQAAAGVFDLVCPGGVVVYVGIPLEPIAYPVGAAPVKAARVEHVFRYAHVFPDCLRLLGSGAIDVKPLITRTYDFAESVRAFEEAAEAPPGQVKMQNVVHP